MTDVEHTSRKGTGVPISWFPVPKESELPENLRGSSGKRGRPWGSCRTCSGLTASGWSG